MVSLPYHGPITNAKSIVITGGLSVDAVYMLKGSAPGSFKGKFEADNFYYTLGGGAANCATKLSQLSKAFNSHASITLVTRIGSPPFGDVAAQNAHRIANQLIQQSELQIIDVVHGQNIIPTNTVIEHSSDRFIVKQHVGHTEEFKPGIGHTIMTQVHGADYVFIDPRKPFIASTAMIAAKQTGKTTIMDWGEKSWPKDPNLGRIYDQLLHGTDILMVPADAMVKGMKNHEEDPDQLMRRLREDYGQNNILMSDGGKDVQVLIDGKDHKIPVEPHAGEAMYALAAGDTRNAGVIQGLMAGHDLLTAFQRGTAIASVKIKYPGQEFLEYLECHLGSNPLFANDFS